jgi:hypothetical protein
VILLQGSVDQTKEVYSIRKQHKKGGQLKERNLGMDLAYSITCDLKQSSKFGTS